MKRSLRGVCLLGIVAAAANANILPSLKGVDFSGAFTYKYSISFGPGIKLDRSSAFSQFFTIYDFAGFNGKHSSPADWEFVDDGPGMSEFGLNIANDPNRPDLTWKYVGRRPLSGPGSAGPFWAQSTFGPLLRTADFAGQGTGASGYNLGSAVRTITTVSVPDNASIHAPEPATGLLLGCGLVAISLFSRRFLRS